MRRDFMAQNLHRQLEKMTFETLGDARKRGDEFRVARPSRAPLDLAICTHQFLGRNLICLCSILMSRRALFPSDLCVLRKRRIDHLSDPRQSPRLHDTYRQKTPQAQREFFEAFPFSETLHKCPRSIKSGKAQKNRAFWRRGYGECTGEDSFKQLSRKCRAGLAQRPELTAIADAKKQDHTVEILPRRQRISRRC
jgi:hypothetical protein